MVNKKLFTYIGFAVKAGKVKYGVDNITACKKAPEAIIVSENLSENSFAKLDKYLSCHSAECFTANLDELLPGKNCKAIGITDLQLANAVKSEIKESRI